MELAAVRHPGGHAEALAEGPGGHVDEAEPGSGVTLQVGVDLPEVEELLGGEEASLGPGGVEDRGGVALGEDEPVVAGDPGLLDGVPHDAVEEDGHDLGHGGAGCRMAGVAGRGHLDRVDPELVSQVLELTELVLGSWEWHGESLKYFQCDGEEGQ